MPSIVRQITAEQAAPASGLRSGPGRGACWIGFGFDVDGETTWTTCYGCWRPGFDPETRTKEVSMLEQFAALCNVSGLPEVR
jgi:hypothetical protein